LSISASVIFDDDDDVPAIIIIVLRCSSLSFFSISKEARLLLVEGRDAFVTINSQG
jgi:hypothetical protein